MPRADWRVGAEEPVGALQNGVWYRSPLWEKDHALGRPVEFVDDGLAWCGRPLQLAREGWGDPKLEGLWITNRTAAKCSECARLEREWKDRG
jgi:hypothetical protein